MPGTLVLSTTSSTPTFSSISRLYAVRSSWCGATPRPDRECALRIEVDEQHAPSDFGQGRTEVDRRRRLADAALLVAQRDDARRTVLVERLGLRHRALASGHCGIRRLDGLDAEQA